MLPPKRNLFGVIWGEESRTKFLISSGIFLLALDSHVWPPVLLPILAMTEAGNSEKGQKGLVVPVCCLNP